MDNGDCAGLPACAECGGHDLAPTRPGWASGAWQWLHYGRPWRPVRQVCRECGATAGWVPLRPARLSWSPRWTALGRLIRTTSHRRQVVPVPRTYLLAVLAGAVVGAVSQVVLGWPWWLFALGFVGSVFVVLWSSAFWQGGSSAYDSLGTAALRVLSPRRGEQRAERERVQRLQEAPFPLYGLPPSWPGHRWLGGWGERQSRGQRAVVEWAQLGHEDGTGDDGWRLLVEAEETIEDAAGAWRRRERHRAMLLWLRGQPRPTEQGELRDRQASASAAADAAWSQVTIPVDGRPVTFAWFGQDRHWVAYAELPGHAVGLRCQGLAVDGVELVRITDVARCLRD